MMPLPHPGRIAAVLLGVLLQGAPAAADLLAPPRGETSIALDDELTLFVRTPEAGKVVAEIYRGDVFMQGLMFGNALFDDGDLKRVRLCPGCGEVVFLAISDRSSTYGAVSGVIVWRDERSFPRWEMTELPLMRPYVTEPDAKGLSRLMDDAMDSAKRPLTVEYRFRDGSLERVSP